MASHLAIDPFVPLYFAAILFDISFLTGASPEWLVVILFISGSFLIAVTVGYASDLLTRLQSTQNTLYRAHQELKLLHDLGSSLQLSPSISDVVKQALIAITGDLGFGRATIGLITDEAQAVDRWQAYDRRSESTQLSVQPESFSLPVDDSFIWHAIIEKSVRHFHLPTEPGESLAEGGDTDAHRLLHPFQMNEGLVLPLIWGAKPVGVLLIELAGTSEQQADLMVLSAIARQTAVTLRMMMTRLRHAKESAVFEERTRISLDLHDTISQSLFGLVYTLQGCLRLVQDNPQALQLELEWALATAEEVRQEMRATIHDIWPAELTAQQFEEDLRSYAANVLQAAELDITSDPISSCSIGRCPG